jgi:predicted DNA-binding transcriptional regulator AlpA
VIDGVYELNTDDEYFRVKDICAFLKVGRTTVQKYIRNGDFPEPCRLSTKLTVWRKQDIIDWLEKKKA